MIIHRGRGGLIALIAFLCLLLAEAFTRIHYHDDSYYQQHPWPKLLAFAVAAVLIWWLSPRPKQPANPSSSEQLWRASHSQQAPALEPESTSFKLTLFRETDSLFFIPVRYWPLILCALGLVFYFIPTTYLP